MTLLLAALLSSGVALLLKSRRARERAALARPVRHKP